MATVAVGKAYEAKTVFVRGRSVQLTLHDTNGRQSLEMILSNDD